MKCLNPKSLSADRQAKSLSALPVRQQVGDRQAKSKVLNCKFGMIIAEFGMRKVEGQRSKVDFGIRNSEC
ncbi:MAG: hypothetical protein KAX28_04105 [Candidatus Marinimicrobia bacterium]|nr:hypothetical protein [Candidatus Neomarinimicrobiota bacterium]